MRSTSRGEFRAGELRNAAGIAAIFVLVGIAGVGAGAASAAAPYPQSPVLTGVIWDFAGLTRYATGSDLWPVTWTADDNLQAAWGDGGGFGGDNTNGRVSLGVARVEGMPPSPSGVNVFGGVDPLAPATFTGKPTGIISVGGTLYMAVVDNDTWLREKFGRSTDGGMTWTFNSDSGWDFAEPDGAFSDATLLNFGKDNAGARDGYVYAYSADERARDLTGKTLTGIVMFRTPAAHIMDRSYYEYYAGVTGGGQPVWTADITQRMPVFTDPNGVGYGARVMFNPGVGRYILTAWHNQTGGWGIFDAPEPWGPWTTVAYYENWIDSTFKFSFNLNQKWMSADGRAFDMIFSGTGVYDSFNLIEGSFGLATAVLAEGSPARPILRAWPGPFCGGLLNVEFYVPAGGPNAAHESGVAVFDVTGRKVRTLAREVRDAGIHVLTWDGRDDQGSELASGVYFVSARAVGLSHPVKVVLVR